MTANLPALPVDVDYRLAPARKRKYTTPFGYFSAVERLIGHVLREPFPPHIMKFDPLLVVEKST